MRTVIVSVGTALINNMSRTLGIGKAQLLDNADAVLDVLRQAYQAYDTARGASEEEDARRAIGAKSAEINTLVHMPLHGPKDDRLAWLSSDTIQGKWCAGILHTLYKERGFDSDIHIAEGLTDAKEDRFVQFGLRSLVNVTMGIIDKSTNPADKAAGPANVIICATGGYKVQIAYLNLIGLLCGIEVCYMFESFDTVIRLPRLPLTWQADWVRDHHEFFASLANGKKRATSDVRRYLNSHRGDDLEQMIADDADGFSHLTPVGEAIYRAYWENIALRPRR